MDDRALSFLAGLGLGAGLMYALDPQAGRRRRALARDKAQHLWKEAREGWDDLQRDVTNRATGLAAQARAGRVPGWRQVPGFHSPTGRLLVGVTGAGILAYGATQKFPVACVVGTVGLILMAGATTNTSPRDLVPEEMPNWVPDSVSSLAQTGQEWLHSGAEKARSALSSAADAACSAASGAGEKLRQAASSGADRARSTVSAAAEAVGL